MAFGNQIAMEETLELSLGRIFGVAPSLAVSQSRGKKESSKGVTTSTYLIQRATETYKRAQEALRLGDWARYGEETKQLGEILQQLN